MQNGWDAGLIPDEYLIEAYFQKEEQEIEDLQITQSNQESALEEAVVEAIELLEYEADEDEKITTALAKRELKTEISYLKDEKLKPKEAEPYETFDTKIKDLEKEIKETKAALKQKQEELDLKLIIKRYGVEDEKATANALVKIANRDLETLDADVAKAISFFKSNLSKTDSFDAIKKATTTLEKQLKKDKTNPEKLQEIVKAKAVFKTITKPYNAALKNLGILKVKLNSLDSILQSIGGIISVEESQKLILKKHFDLINTQLQRYLNTEKRMLVNAFENLWDKYAVSAQSIELKREETMVELNKFLTALNYLD
jgi:type I restriction enzyme M protein